MLLKAKELARELNITVKTLYSYMKRGIIPEGRKFGKSRRWDLNEVLNCIDNNKEAKS